MSDDHSRGLARAAAQPPAGDRPRLVFEVALEDQRPVVWLVGDTPDDVARLVDWLYAPGVIERVLHAITDAIVEAAR